MIGPDAVIRETIARDVWSLTLVGTPHEARCKLCEVEPIGPDETEWDYNEKLKAAGAYHGPDTREACTRWVDAHLRRKHGRIGITQTYSTQPGAERWTI